MLGEVFVNRKKLFAAVEAVLDGKGRGRRHVFLEGRRLVGKTRFLRELVERRGRSHAVYLDLGALVTTPALFARNAFGLLLRPFVGEADGEPGMLSPWVRAASSLPDDAREVVEDCASRIREAARDDLAMLRAVLDLPERLARVCSRSLVVALDGFESLLDMAAHDGTHGLPELVEEILSGHERVRYVVSAQSRHRLRELRLRRGSRWSRCFRTLSIGPLNRYDSYFLASLVFGAACRTIPRPVLPTVAHYARGVPFYVEALATASVAQAEAAREEVSQRHVNRALVVEVLSPGGRIHQACQRVLAESLASVPDEKTLRGILQVLAEREGRSLDELAQAMGRAKAEVRDHVAALERADLLWRRDRRAYFCDPMLRFFIHQALDAHWRSADPSPDEVDAQARRFFEAFLLGRPGSDLETELRVRALSTEFEGQSLSGRYFGCDEEVVLPAETAEEELIDFDNEGSVLEEPAIIASDLLLKGRRRWMVEVKSEHDPIDADELLLILRKRRFFEGRYRCCFDRVWVVSDEGFTGEARRFARDHRMLISARSDLEGLEELLHHGAFVSGEGDSLPRAVS